MLHPFENVFKAQALANDLHFAITEVPGNLGLLAVQQLQAYLQQEINFNHNFGINTADLEPATGKMFGVLVVRDKNKKLGYLAAFSGKLGGGNQYAHFVPPVFDTLKEGGFVNAGMSRLTEMTQQINQLELLTNAGPDDTLSLLKMNRKNYSVALQDQIFEQYHFLNQAGQSKSLVAIFQDAENKKPPAGAGECAAPKLLQYAFLHELEPLSLAEFWWGASSRSTYWQHGRFYKPCVEKCRSILAYMLSLPGD